MKVWVVAVEDVTGPQSLWVTRAMAEEHVIKEARRFSVAATKHFNQFRITEEPPTFRTVDGRSEGRVGWQRLRRWSVAEMEVRGSAVDALAKVSE